jgi:hypothetical protein
MMVNLEDIEHRLNTNEQARQEFLANPVAFLAREGIGISQANEVRLRERVAKLQASPQAVPGGLPRENLPGNIRLIIRDELA